MESTSGVTEGPLTLHNSLKNIRELDPIRLKTEFDTYIPANLAPEPSFWLLYSDEEVCIGLRACLLLWTVSNPKIIPRNFQLRATIAMMTGKDCLIDVGTGQGKTLCMVLPCLLAPGNLSIVFSPLKRLQAVHVLGFTDYSVRAIAINEDTPSSPQLWKNIEDGEYTALLVQPEQLFMIDGHLPRLARLIQERSFAKLVHRLHVDEAHFIHSAGTAQYGLPAFREAWGRLGEFRVKIGKSIPVQALSGTQPPHIKKVIIENLLFDESNLVSIKMTSNRPNIIYATHPIVGQLSDFRNLDFLIPHQCPQDIKLPKTIVFHDDSDECANAAFYLDRRLHPSLWDKGVVRHYHGKMSIEYLTQVYEDFCKPDGVCRILHATSGASTGLDIPDIDVVIQYGIPRDVPSTLQRGGRGGRNTTTFAIFLIMYEPWVLEIDLSKTAEDPSDPDFPNSGILTKYSTKRQRTGRAMIFAIQSVCLCLRVFFAENQDDTSIEAVAFTFRYCCDRHPGDGFHIRNFFQGQFLYQDGSRLFYGDEDDLNRQEILPPPKEKRRTGEKSRKIKDRSELKSRLILWRVEAHAADNLASVRPPTFILDDPSIKILAALHPDKVRTTANVVKALNETEEWGKEWSQKILTVIQSYDQELLSIQKASLAEEKNKQKRQKLQLDKDGFKEDTERRLQESSARGFSLFANRMK